jgi:hypothetical protein
MRVRASVCDTTLPSATAISPRAMPPSTATRCCCSSNGLDIQQIGARQPVLGDENGLLVPLDVREQFGCLAFEGGNTFGAHD